MDNDTKLILKAIITNQNMLSLAIRRVLPSGNTETTPTLQKIEEYNKTLIEKLK